MALLLGIDSTNIMMYNFKTNGDLNFIDTSFNVIPKIASSLYFSNDYSNNFFLCTTPFVDNGIYKESHAILYKYNRIGELIFKKDIGYCGFTSWLYDVANTDDKGFIMIGVTNCHTNGGLYEPYIVRVDSLGNSWTNVVSGHVFIDNNKNGVKDINESLSKNRIVQVLPEGRCQLTNENGMYYVPSSPDNQIVRLILPNFLWTQSAPSNNGYYTYSFMQTNDTVTNNNFGMYINKYCPILMLSMCAPNFRRCFNSHFRIRYCNEGTDTARNVSIPIDLDNALAFVSATVPVDSTAGSGHYKFLLGTVLPETCGYFNLDVYVSCDSAKLWLGDTVCMDFRISPYYNCCSDTMYEYSARFPFCRTVRGAYDPNEFFLLQPSTACIDTTDYLTYQINFQNTGTDTAFNINVDAVLSPLLDLSTIKPLAGTHPYTFNFIDKDKVEFSFKNIQLPDSTTDQANSHGSVTFSIKQKPNNFFMKDIVNYAAIYFDFNSSVITNFDTVHFCKDIIESVYNAGNNSSVSVLLFPTPSTDKINISCSEKISNLKIYTVLGSLMQDENINDTAATIDISAFEKGVYFIELNSNLGIVRKKIIIQ